jgi:hypothetical protein
MINHIVATKAWSSATVDNIAYGFNMLRPLWKQSTDYIGEGKLKIKKTLK